MKTDYALYRDMELDRAIATLSKFSSDNKIISDILEQMLSHRELRRRTDVFRYLSQEESQYLTNALISYRNGEMDVNPEKIRNEGKSIRDMIKTPT